MFPPRAIRGALSWNRRLFFGRFGATLCCLSLMALDALGASVPSGFVDVQLFAGLTSPTAITATPDGRILILQQNGIVRVARNDTLLAANFYTVPDVDSSSERGCLGIVTDPGFVTNRYVYIYCTVKNATGSNNRVLRVTEANDAVVAGSERVVMDLPNVPTTTTFHMGGGLRFGGDGKLYVAVGDHQVRANAPNPASAFGKMHRINADGTVPSDNPFYSTPGAFRSVWAVGLRNPFSMDVQAGTGRIYINDVGEALWEEINLGRAGANYGWPTQEGPGTNPSFDNPVHAYQHTGACSISGGAFYNPASLQFPAGTYQGKYFFADFCSGQIRYIDPASPATSVAFASGIRNPVAIAVAAGGSLYYVARNQGTGTATPGAGTLSKISFTGSQLAQITSQPADVTVLLGQPATFSVVANNATSYQWFRNGVPVSGATSPSFTIPVTAMSDSGAVFRARVSNALGSVDSRSALLTITTNQAPAARIDAPAIGTSYTPGQVITYSGIGTDPEDGMLPPSRMSWRVDFQHDAHAHNFISPTTGASGSFVTSAFEAGEANSWLRITLTVTDSQGQTASVFRDLFKHKQIADFAFAGAPVNGYGPVEKDRSNGGSQANDGITIALGGIPYPRGLGVHAPSDVRFNLGKSCSGSFVSDIGVDDEVGNKGTVVFQVFVDGVKAYDSGVVRGSDARKPVNVSVAAINELRLVVEDAGDGKSFDHADWAGAHVTGCGPQPQASIMALQVGDGVNSSDWSVQYNLQAGDRVYGDRTYTFESLPSALLGGTWIRAANDSKTFAGEPLVTFVLDAAADVHVAFDNRAAVPPWVDESWVDTSADIKTREGPNVRTFSVYRKHYNAGSVSLQPWGGGSNTSMYLVVVR